MILLLLVAQCLMLTLTTGYKFYIGYRLYRIFPENEHMKLLDRYRDDPAIDFWNDGPGFGRPTDILVSPKRIAEVEHFFKNHAIFYKILVRNIGRKIKRDYERRKGKYTAVRNNTITFDRYYRYKEINTYLRRLARRYPHLASVDSIGKSFEGRDINVLKIASRQSGTMPIIIIDAGIHAREWIAPAMALYIINQLVENKQNYDLIRNVEWRILPVLNVDGYEYSHTTDRLWLKTRSRTPGQECIGVNANRNNGYHWMEVGASAFPCSNRFAGKFPFSEPETAAFKNYVLPISNQTKMYISFHSYGSAILYPWGYKNKIQDFKNLQHSLAAVANAAQMKAGGNPYRIGPISEVHDKFSGGSVDYMKGPAKVEYTYFVDLPGWSQNLYHISEKRILYVVNTFFQAVRYLATYVSYSHNHSDW